MYISCCHGHIWFGMSRIFSFHSMQCFVHRACLCPCTKRILTVCWVCCRKVPNMKLAPLARLTVHPIFWPTLMCLHLPLLSWDHAYLMDPAKANAMFVSKNVLIYLLVPIKKSPYNAFLLMLICFCIGLISRGNSDPLAKKPICLMLIRSPLGPCWSPGNGIWKWLQTHRIFFKPDWLMNMITYLCELHRKAGTNHLHMPWMSDKFRDLHSSLTCLICLGS